MAYETESSFSKFQMSDAEKVSASVLTLMQKQHIHNLRVDVAETILNLEEDIDAPLKHLKDRAKLQGMLDAYAGLINISLISENTLAQLNSQGR